MKHLIRKTFLNLTWDARDLDAAAEFWLRLYEAEAENLGLSADPLHGVEIRLQGFPRHQAGKLLEELTRRLPTTPTAGSGAPASDFPSPDISQPDPDTISASSGLLPGKKSPPIGLGLPQLAGLPFDGLLAEVRIRVEGVKPGWVRRKHVPTTLVLVGELRDGQLLLKALWRAGPSAMEDHLCWSTVWPDQDEWLAALKQFRETEMLPLHLASKLFVAQGADRGGQLAVRLIHVPLDQPRLDGLLVRVGLFCALFAGLGVAVHQLIQHHRSIWLLLLAAPAWCVLWLIAAFVQNEGRLWFRGYRLFRDRFTRLYETSLKHTALSRAEADARLDHPWARKYTAELESAGFTYAGDIQIEPDLNGDNLIRVFYAPDRTTYLNVLFCMSTSPDPVQSLRLWPAAVSFLAHTYYADGGRAASISGKASGYRKNRSGADCMLRVFPDTDDPVAFTRLHAAAAEAWAQENGRTPLRHEPFNLYLRRQDEIHQELQQVYAQTPCYTWGDHLHWYLQSPRREFRG
jgi:hypothetical protein